MALKAKNNNSGSRIEPMEAGTYPARLVQLIDLGLQAQAPYKGQEKKPADRVMLTYEFLDEFLKDENGDDITDKRRFLTEDFPNYTRVAERSIAAARIGAFDPSGAFDAFDPAMVGVPVMVTVVQNPSKKPGDDRIFNNINSVAPMRSKEAAAAPDLQNEALVFDFDEPDMDVFFKLSDWVQKKIKEAVNFSGSHLHQMIGASEEENKPSQTATAEIIPISPVTPGTDETPY